MRDTCPAHLILLYLSMGYERLAGLFLRGIYYIFDKSLFSGNITGKRVLRIVKLHLIVSIPYAHFD